MANISHIEKRVFEELFGMNSGYVLDFSDRTFSSFFSDTGKINIDDDKYRDYGVSKAKRLRSFWEKEPDRVVGKILNELLSVWLYNNRANPKAIDDKNYISALKAANRLAGITSAEVTEDDFLEKDFGNISLKKIKIESSLIPILELRIQEIQSCLKGKSPLAAIILSGSVLEGLLLGTAYQQPAKFNQSNASPKDKTGKVLQFHEWTLGAFIDVACEIGLTKVDVKKFSHSLRDFRNYVHPYAQMTSQFSPDQHTAKICLQVLKAAIADLSGER